LDPSGRIVFSGPVPNEEIDRFYRRSRGFVLPSKRETFGLVYVEALLNGAPILYSRGTGVDGLFPEAGVSVNPRSVASIARGLRNLCENSEEYRKNVERIRKTGGLDIFTPHAVYEKYKKTLNAILFSS
jgi:glycosyltransferase involved in cell wall biosynthesis